jgi:redox-sensitive bicupin YhaK (pirin superfamily)
MGFGLLKWMNEDWLAPGSGFEFRPQDNMEIISIVLEGMLEHRDSLGNHQILAAGDVQLISSGTGIFHSEINPDRQHSARILQIGILPYKRNSRPAYHFLKEKPMIPNQFYELVSPVQKAGNLKIFQGASMSLGKFEAGEKVHLQPSENEMAQFLFLIQGKITIFDHKLEDRDAIGFKVCTSAEAIVEMTSFLLLMHIPLNHSEKKIEKNGNGQ